MQRTLCFDDVLLVPQYSDIETRSNIDLSVPGFDDDLSRLTPLHKPLRCPLVGSPMDTVMGPASAVVMARAGGFGVLHRYCTIEEQRDAYLATCRLLDDKNTANVMVAIGATGDYIERASALYEVGCRAFCVDVAHGHHFAVKQALKALRKKFGKDVHIMSGNVATLEAFNDLADWGSDSVRVGIGGGCFTPKTSITMGNGTKKFIEDVKIGDVVLTHTGESKQVLNTLERSFSDLLIKINDTLTCTLNHEIYVVENKDVPHITDDNLHQFAKWIPASELNENYSLIEIIDS